MIPRALSSNHQRDQYIKSQIMKYIQKLRLNLLQSQSFSVIEEESVADCVSVEGTCDFANVS